MRATLFAKPLRMAIACSLALGSGFVAAGTWAADLTSAELPLPTVTNVAQIPLLAAQNPTVSYSFHLAGNVWWACPAKHKFVIQDSSGAEELELATQGQPARSGQRVRLQGNGTITRSGAGFQIGAIGPVVDNDGIHSLIEKSGSVYLTAGRNPVRVEWFNGVEQSGLEVDYEEPGLARRRIPDSALYRIQFDAATGRSNWVNGVDYECCAADGEVLPDFDHLTPFKTGTAANFDLSVATRPEHVGLRFTGFLKVPRNGVYTFYTKSDDGSQLFVGKPSLNLRVIGAAAFPEPRSLAIGQTVRDEEEGQWAKVEGKVAFARDEADGMELELSAGAGRLRVEVADVSGLSPALLLNRRVQAVGFCESAFTADGQKVPGKLLVPGGKQIVLLASPTETDAATPVPGSLPLLTTAAEVHSLKREDAQRGYPVRMRGVVTCVLPERQAFTLEDSTRGLYVEDLSESRSIPPKVGEFLEVEGVTDPSLFAPIVDARRVSSLGAGHLPEPVRPTWDQLMNGSLDAQYVELQGVITAVQTNSVALFTRGGLIRVELRVNGLKPGGLRRFEDALVRIRGCLLATWNYLTHQVKLGKVRIYNADIMVDQPAPTDLFSIPAKSVPDLLLFDPQAGAFQRVKVRGQIIYAREPEYFLMQGTNGLRFIEKEPLKLQAGDEVEVVGFPDLLSTAAPLLREATARKIGHAPLPPAMRLEAGDLIRGDHDSTRVRVKGLLVGRQTTRANQVLELQNGVRTFVATLTQPDESVRSLAVGSRLELTGVYAGRGGNRAEGRDIASFELLLNSPADLQVLARPPWWTLERLLVIVGALACVLAATFLWITQLHRRVEERTAQLGQQIQERQRVEHQRALEQERARIAQDLHDEMGSGITEISMLAARAKAATVPDERRNRYLEQVGDKAREMVTALDEIVWAMNPRHDSLASLVSYFSLYADRFLGLANIAWRLEGPAGQTDHALDSRRRHQLFLAFKEALTNVVRHSGATEVRLNINVHDGEVQIAIADNGRGLPAGTRTEQMDGVANMRGRLEKLGGRFEVAGEPGGGTVVRFYVPAG